MVLLFDNLQLRLKGRYRMQSEILSQQISASFSRDTKRQTEWWYGIKNLQLWFNTSVFLHKCAFYLTYLSCKDKMLCLRRDDDHLLWPTINLFCGGIYINSILQWFSKPEYYGLNSGWLSQGLIYTHGCIIRSGCWTHRWNLFSLTKVACKPRKSSLLCSLENPGMAKWWRCIQVLLYIHVYALDAGI